MTPTKFAAAWVEVKNDIVFIFAQSGGRGVAADHEAFSIHMAFPPSASELGAAVRQALAASRHLDTKKLGRAAVEEFMFVEAQEREYRTSVVTTPDGQIPKRKPGAPGARPNRAPASYNSYENRPLGERCLAFAGCNAGPPMLSNGYYKNNYQILQTKNTVVILVEILHDVRIVRLNSQHRADSARPSMGDSIGHYEGGDTLIIETTNFPERENFVGSWRNLKVTEWMTRVSPSKIVYRFQVEDPDNWDKPWGGEGVFNALKAGSVFEYACHEGNYSLEHVLAGARMGERATKRVNATPPASASAKN
jgi:hypothetical protein